MSRYEAQAVLSSFYCVLWNAIEHYWYFPRILDIIFIFASKQQHRQWRQQLNLDINIMQDVYSIMRAIARMRNNSDIRHNVKMWLIWINDKCNQYTYLILIVIYKNRKHGTNCNNIDAVLVNNKHQLHNHNNVSNNNMADNEKMWSALTHIVILHY